MRLGGSHPHRGGRDKRRWIPAYAGMTEGSLTLRQALRQAQGRLRVSGGGGIPLSREQEGESPSPSRERGKKGAPPSPLPLWIPACAGMTVGVGGNDRRGRSALRQAQGERKGVTPILAFPLGGGREKRGWIPACAGMTVGVGGNDGRGRSALLQALRQAQG